MKWDIRKLMLEVENLYSRLPANPLGGRLRKILVGKEARIIR